MTYDDWTRERYARATKTIVDVDGVRVRRGDIGEVADVDVVDGYVIVTFPVAGATLCTLDEIGLVAS